MGLVVPLGEWVLARGLSRSCALARSGQGRGEPSPVQSQPRAWHDRHAGAPRRGLPHRLELEITKPCCCRRRGDRHHAHQLRALGVRFVDDFGTVYIAELLRSFPFDSQDRSSFIKDIDATATAASYPGDCEPGASLGHRDHAEGIETEEQLRCRRGAGAPKCRLIWQSPPRRPRGAQPHRSL